MAGKRRAWESLSASYRNRLSRAGVTREHYQSGGNVSKARGHGQTPEHPREAARNPAKYREYTEKRRNISGGSLRTPEDEAYELNELRDNAMRSVDGKLGSYIKYKRRNVLANIYGGTGGAQFLGVLGDSPEEERRGMTADECRWTIQADAEELRSTASNQYKGNPWFYH